MCIRDSCALTREQFTQLLHEMPISKKENFIETCYMGLKTKKKTVPFQSIRNLYESSQPTLLNKNMLLILFRGVSKKKELFLDKESYLKIATLALEDFNKDLYEQKFAELAETDTQKISHKNVALSVFGIRVGSKDDPFTESIQVRSPHSACCLLI